MPNKPFTQKVYDLVATIPAGKVMTYGQVATLVGSSGAARAVGMCMKHNPDTTVVPCHRVVSSDGSMTGYSAKGGIASKKKKLIAEGVIFKGDKVDISRSLFSPTS